MAILTRFVFRGTDEVIVRRARAGYLYFVEGIQLTFQTAVDNNVYILDRWMKHSSSPVIGATTTNLTPSIIASFNNEVTTDQNKTHYVGPGINHLTKYLSVAYETSQAVTFAAVVYGKFVKATKSDLIWEFITKRHR